MAWAHSGHGFVGATCQPPCRVPASAGRKGHHASRYKPAFLFGASTSMDGSPGATPAWRESRRRDAVPPQARLEFTRAAGRPGRNGHRFASRLGNTGSGHSACRSTTERRIADTEYRCAEFGGAAIRRRLSGHIPAYGDSDRGRTCIRRCACPAGSGAIRVGVERERRCVLFHRKQNLGHHEAGRCGLGAPRAEVRLASPMGGPHTGSSSCRYPMEAA